MSKSIGLALLLVPLLSHAHSPSVSSTLLVQQGDTAWVLHFSAALTAFEYEVEQRYGADAYDSPEAFEQLVADVVRTSVTVEADGAPAVSFGAPVVRLGHETSVSFPLEGLPAGVQRLRVRNASFEHVGHHRSALVIVADGVDKEQFALQANNDFAVDLQRVGTSYALAESRDSYGAVLSLATVLGGLAIAVVLSNFIAGRHATSRLRLAGSLS